MKKALAISLLVICNMAAVCAISAVGLFIIVCLSINLFSLLFNLAFTARTGLAAVIALGYASCKLLSVFERKYSLKAKWFVLAAYISPIIGAAVYWIVFMSLDAAGHYGSEWFDGIAEGLYTFLMFTAAVEYLISGWAWISKVTSRQAADKSPK